MDTLLKFLLESAPAFGVALSIVLAVYFIHRHSTVDLKAAVDAMRIANQDLRDQLAVNRNEAAEMRSTLERLRVSLAENEQDCVEQQTRTLEAIVRLDKAIQSAAKHLEIGVAEAAHRAEYLSGRAEYLTELVGHGVSELRRDSERRISSQHQLEVAIVSLSDRIAGLVDQRTHVSLPPTQS